MRFVDEFRDPARVRAAADAIARAATRPWTLMEVCGGQTHAIVRFGIDRLLPESIRLLHGPGCPVCVTSVSLIDHAISIAAKPGIILASFGDMLRVPGSGGDLISAKAAGADVRVVLSPLDALALARSVPDREVVFFAVGFETTAPATALAAAAAEREGIDNFSVLAAHVRVPPALEALLADPDCQVDGFLAAGHVCSVMGLAEYAPIARRHRVPLVATGFEPLDILQGLLMCVRQLEEGRAEVENQYARAVRAEGNPAAQSLLAEIFERVSVDWRGMGEIPDSGLRLRPRYSRFDAAHRFAPDSPATARMDCGECLSGLVLKGARRPDQCPAFATRCTPEHPLGATMVSSEGACAAYYRYRREEAAPS